MTLARAVTMVTQGREEPAMIRVLHVINWFRRGGLETQVLRLLRDYDRSRFHMDACVIGPEPGDLADEAGRYGAEIVSCPKSPNLWAFSRRFSHVVGHRNYSVIHSHGVSFSGATLRGAAIAGVPVRIAHLRNMGHGLSVAHRTWLARSGRTLVSRWGRRWVGRFATHVMAVSGAALRERWPDWERRSDRFFVWTNGVDTTRFAPRMNGNVSTRSPVVISIGNFFLRSKRQDGVLRIFAGVRKAMPETRLVFVGTGTHEQDYRRLAEQLGLSESVDFLGHKDRTEVPELLRSAALFLYCSESEGLPNVLLEAQAAGAPVVATDIPAHREALAPVFHEYLFEPNAVEDAAGNVVGILNDPELGRLLGAAGREYVSERYNAQSCLRTLENYYISWVKAARDNP